MDAKVLVIISLGSLVLIIGAVAALWLRARGSSSGPRSGAMMPTAPAPARPRSEESAEKEVQAKREPARGELAQPSDEPAPTFGYGSVPPPASITPPAPPPRPSRPSAPITPPKPLEPEPSEVEAEPIDDFVSAEPEAPAAPEPIGGLIPAAPQAPATATGIQPPAPQPQAPVITPVNEQPKMDESGEETEASLPADLLLDDESAPLLGGVPELPYLEEAFNDHDGYGTSTPAPAKDILFSAYYPKEIAPEKWEALHAYMFKIGATGEVEADAGKQLGSRLAEFRGVRTPARVEVPEGAMVTATPQMPGFQFNPPTVTIGFYKDWHRFDFEVRTKDAPLNQSTNGLITFTVEGIIIADIPLSIYLGENTVPATPHPNAVAKAYESIFCSYSHQDDQIVARAERAYKALGLDYLRDVVSLKSGQDWSDELLTLINRADIFQLFWSESSAQSQHVRFEWEHALQVAGWRSNFIRPVYWQDPKPKIPDELKHIHFAYQPDLGD